MQFKYPEILWGLLLLLIPIFIHLFQLRRFKKTPFTNVKFLQLVVSESRKSSTLKKWLLLLSRLGLIAAVVISFAQPFSANETALKEKETVFYLDNSYSMDGKNENGSILYNAIQEFIKNTPQDQLFTLFTNTTVFKNITIKDIQNDLLEITPSADQLTINDILLKGNTFFSKLKDVQKNLVLISDFQRRMGGIIPQDSIMEINVFYLNPLNHTINNSSIDSVYIENRTNETIDIAATLTTNTTEESLPVSLYNDQTLIAKTAAKFNKNKKAKVTFSINANEKILGKVTITDNGLEYDNQFYFNIDEKSKIKVLVIGKPANEFLDRIYSEEEFELTSTSLSQLNYSDIENQHLIIINEIDELPSSLATAVKSFHDDGGSFVVIPSTKGDLNSYNQLANFFNTTSYSSTITQNLAISHIKVAHDLFNNVFENNVDNFQFPSVKTYHRMQTIGQVAIEFQNKEPFLISNDNAHFFATALSNENSNFQNSPLIVPTFYNIGINSLKLPSLYANIEDNAAVEIPITLQQDENIKVVNETIEFIPLQRALPKKVQLTFMDNPKKTGIYKIMHDQKLLRNISFNENRKESELVYSQIPENNGITSINKYFTERQKNNAINEFWKWFAILAFAFIIIETLLQRFIK
ncbi:BatA domain-containing protein [Maribacter confluentis]|uniref:BatA domain-containing protein n=1 Tax=Maribacter confluentis TaxID=1656093 RepID=A0ABT8RU16_9FLAO|nr:BatA domain-containing protein [Maribacter confluentis]MDO1514431.1 BatA domain-containing protein [Maribacter confluentis]